MQHCPKCGSEVGAEMAFCPKCGASLKAEPYRESEEIGKRMEKMGKELGERMEKMGKDIGKRIEEEVKKGEWEERYEKGETVQIHEFGFLGPLIGGLTLIFLGLMFYLMVTRGFGWELLVAFFLIIVGVIVIVAVAYWTIISERLRPKT